MIPVLCYFHKTSQWQKKYDILIEFGCSRKKYLHIIVMSYTVYDNKVLIYERTLFWGKIWWFPIEGILVKWISNHYSLLEN